MNTQDLNAQAKIIRREGKILDRFDWTNSKGCNSGFYIEWKGFEYRITMRNGEVVTLKQLWSV